MIKKIILGLCLIGSFFIWYGCGGSYEAPEGSTVTINPDSYSVTIDPVTYPSELFNTQLFTISVQNPSGVPLKDVSLRITYPFAVPSDFAFLQLFDNETPVNTPMTVKTDENGLYILKVVYKSGGGLSYFGDIEVSAGDSFASATFTVEAGAGTDDTEE